MLGKIEIFNPENTSWESYLEQFENWIFLNDIPEEKQSRTLLALVRPKTDEIVKTAALGKNIYELAKEEPEEPLRDYVLKLQKRSQTCNFKDFTDEALRDCFILGLNENCKQARPSLLVEPNLSFNKAVNLTYQIRNSALASKEMDGLKGEVCKLAVSRKIFPKRRELRHCYCCGESGYIRQQCLRRDESCKFCGVKGHVEEACRKNRFNNNKINSNVVKSLELYSPPILISFKINSNKRVFKFDTGSPISVINQKSFSNIDSPIKSTKTYLTSYTGHEIKFIGVCSVSVSKDSASFTGNLFVVDTGPNIV
ncbi:hypothetical protein HZS_5743, partial [Henneguya salminicola]